MEKAQGVLQDSYGNVIAGADITVYDAGTSNESTIYSDDGVTAITMSSFTTDTDGKWEFYAADGDYDIKFVKSGYDTVYYYDIQLLDRSNMYNLISALSAYDFAQSGDDTGTPSATASEQVWLDLDDGSVYKSTGTGTGNWVYQYRIPIYNSDGDLDIQGNYTIRNQTIQDIQPFPYIHFDGDDYGVITDAENVRDIFENGGSVIFHVRPNSDGTGDNGRIFQKGGNALYVTDESGGYVTLKFLIDFTTTNGSWTCSDCLKTNDWSTIEVVYDASSTSNDPTIYINGKEQTIIETITPVGSYTSDSGSDLYIGDRTTNDRGFEGDIGANIYIFNREHTATEAKEFSANPHKALDWADEGASNTEVLFDVTADSDNNDFTGGLGDWATGNTWDSQTNPSANMVLSATANNQRCTIPGIFTAGKKFRLVYDASSITGTITLRAWDGDYVTLGTFSEGTGNTLEFTLPENLTNQNIYIGATASGDTITLDNLYLYQIGATAAYKAVDIIADSSGNAVYTKDSNPAGNHITWTGPVVGNRSDQQTPEEGDWTPANGDFGIWTSPVFTATYKKYAGQCTITLKQTSGTIDPEAAGKYITGVPFTPSAIATGQASSTAYADNGAISLQTNGRIYFSNDIGSTTDLEFSITYPTDA